jgi:hypothetical protein
MPKHGQENFFGFFSQNYPYKGHLKKNFLLDPTLNPLPFKALKIISFLTKKPMVLMSSYPIETSMNGLQINESARPRGVFNKARKQPQSTAQSNVVPNPTQSYVQHEDYNNTLANENLYKDNEERFTEVYNPPTAPKNSESLNNADLFGSQKNATNYSHTRSYIAQEHPIEKAAHFKENENFVQNRAPKKQVNDVSFFIETINLKWEQG